MKTLLQLILLGFFLFVCSSSYSQITVDSQERVIFGKNKIWYDGISIVDEKTTSGGYPFRIVRKANDNVYFARATTNAVNSGLVMFSNGNIAMGTNLPSGSYSNPYAVLEISNNSSSQKLLSLKWNTSYGDAIYIEKPSSSVQVYDYAINYWGGTSSNSFRVRDDGVVTARGVQLYSDVSLKSEIETLGGSLEKVKQLRGVSYYMGDSQKEEKIPFDELLTHLKKNNPKITAETLKQMQAEKKRKDIGVIAQEVEKVLPEAVSTNEDGLKSVSYSDLTVLLIEAVKEQQVLIDQLNEKIEDLQKKVETIQK